MASSESSQPKSRRLNLLQHLTRSESRNARSRVSTDSAREVESLLHPYSATECKDTPTHAALRRYLVDLTENSSWVKRRVETVEFLDISRRERRVTLDISWHAIQERATEAGLLSTGKLPIVVATLPKGLLLDVDLRGEHGRPMPVLTSHQDSFASQLIIAENYLRETGQEMPHDLLDATYEHCRNFSVPTVEPRLESLHAKAPSTANKVAFLGSNFMMLTELEPSAPTFILKVRLVESNEHERRGLLEALSLRSQVQYIEAPGIANAQREHLRIVAPRGMFIESEQLYLDQWTDSSHDRTYSARVAPERAVVYTTNKPRADYYLLATMRPVPRGSFTAAVLWVLTGLLIAACGVAGEAIGAILTSEGALQGRIQIGPLIAVLLSVASLGAANVIRSDEHELSSRLFAPLRGVVLISAVATLTASLAIVLDAWDGVVRWTWTTALVVTAIAATLMISSWQESWRSYR